MKKLLLMALLAVGSVYVSAQAGQYTQVRSTAVLPTTCDPLKGQIVFLQGTGLMQCTATNTWSAVAGGSAVTSFPAVSSLPGTCSVGQVFFRTSDFSSWICTSTNNFGSMAGSVNLVSSLPAPSIAGRLFLLTAGLRNFNVDTGSSIFSPSSFDTNPIAFGADNTGATGATTALTNAVNAVATSKGQRLYVPSGTYLIDTPWHISREIVMDCSAGGYDDPGAVFVLAPGSQITFDKNTISPDGGAADWTVANSCKVVGTATTCAATSGSGTLTSCSNLASLNLSTNDYITVMGSNGALWAMNVPHDQALVGSTTSNTLTLANSVTAGFSGTVTVMKSGFVATTGTTTNGSTSITGVGNPLAFNPGDPIEGCGIPYPDFVTGRNVGASTLTLFTAATSTGCTGNLTKGPLANVAVHAGSVTLNDWSMNNCAGFCYDNNGSVSYTPSMIADGNYVNRMRPTRAGDACAHMQGADANTGTFIGIQSTYCANGGVHDESFLGNTHIGDQTASSSGAIYTSPNANATSIWINDYTESGQSNSIFGGLSTVIGGTSIQASMGGNSNGNIIGGNGQIAPSFYVRSTQGPSLGSIKVNTNTITNVTNITKFNVGDPILNVCLHTGTTVTGNDGVSTLTISANAICSANGNGAGAPLTQTEVDYYLGGAYNGQLAAFGFGYSKNGATGYEVNQLIFDDPATATYGTYEPGWWSLRDSATSLTNIAFPTNLSTGIDMPPGNNGGGPPKFRSGILLGTGLSTMGLNFFNSGAAPTTGSYRRGDWVFPLSATNIGAFVQTGSAISVSATADIAAGSKNLANTSTAFQNSCAPGDAISGTGIPVTATIVSVNTGTASAVLSYAATATTATLAVSCKRLPKAHAATTANTHSSTTVDSVSPTSGWANNDYVSISGCPANTYIQSGGGTASWTLSQACSTTLTGTAVTDPGINFNGVPMGNTSGQLSLTSQVTGILPVANGGTGTASPGLVQGSNVTITGSWPNQTINSTAGSTYKSVSFSATPTFDRSLGNIQEITLTGNVTSSTVTNFSAGQTITLVICQDGTGGRTFAFPANFGNTVTITSTASACTAETFSYDGTTAWNTSGGLSGGSMTWPGLPGIAVYAGSNAWGTSLTAPSGTIVGTTDSQTLTNKTVDGATSTEVGYLSGVTSAIQTQLNAKAPSISPSFTTPSLGASTATSLLATGIVDGLAPVTITTSATQAVGGTYNTGYYFNQNATAATAVTFNLPTAVSGKQYCFENSYNGTGSDTGTLKIQTSAAGQFIIYQGTLSASNGYVISAGAAGDAICVVGTDSTHWTAKPQLGTWTNH